MENEIFNIDDDKKNIFEFNQIIDKIMTKENYIFNGKVIKEIEDKALGITYMTITAKGEKCNQFIRKTNNEKLKNKEISFKISDLRIKIIKDIIYFNILKYNTAPNYTKFKFDKIKIYNSIKEIGNINDNHLFSFILKAKEKFVDLIKNSFYFEDYLGNNIKVEETNDYDFENGKIYIFNGYIYDKKNDRLEKTEISSIEPYFSYNSKIFDLNNTVDIDDINISDKENLFCFKGKIHSFNITKCYLELKDSKDNIIKVFVNYHLLKKISINCQCTFLNFLKINKNEYKFTYLSDIEFKEETFIEFNFINFNVNNNFYNRIKIDDNYNIIDKEQMKIKINDNNEKNIFIKEISYEKFNGQKVINTFNFSLEINKGKINTVNSLLLKKGGHSYQFYIQSFNKEDLPNEISILINNNLTKLNNPDKYGNQLIERFTIVNVDEQNINNIFKNIEKKDIISNEYDWKYLILINDKKEINFKKFIKTKQIKKEKFEISKEIKMTLNELYEKYILNDNEFEYKYGNYETIFPTLDISNYEFIQPLIDNFIDGFKRFIFENTKKDYENIRLISFTTLYFLSHKLGEKFNFFKDNYKSLLQSIINLEYIDRIKILISFTLNTISNIEDNNNDKNLPISTYDWLLLINLEDSNTYEYYPYVKEAYDLFFKIIDEITEEKPFYKGILQLNGIIYKDIISNKLVHSGAILSLLDIKLELIKNINRFLFLSLKKDYLYDYSNFNESGLCVTIYLYSFLNKNQINDKKYFKKITVAILFLLFHECFGHHKKNINNENSLTPRDYYDDNYNDIPVNFEDSGHAFEKLLLNKLLNLKCLIGNDLSEELLKIDLYTDSNFKRLRTIYNIIESEFKSNKINSNNNEIIKDNNKIDENKMKKNIKGKSIENLNKDTDKKDENEIIIPKKSEKNLLYRDLFIIYENKTEEELKSLKDDKNYQRFLMLYKKRKKKYSIKSIMNG